MSVMYKKIQHFEKQHPYGITLLAIAFGGITGSLVNYFFTGTLVDFKTNFYFTIFFTTGELFRVKRNLSKEKEKR